MKNAEELENLVRRLMGGFTEGIEHVLEEVAEKLRLSVGEEGDLDVAEEPQTP